MGAPLTGTGGLFTRLGKIGAIFNAVNLFRGTGALLISTIQRSGANVATVTTAVNHGYTTGDTVTVSGVTSDTVFNSTGNVITVTSNTVFTYPNTGAAAGPYSNQGLTLKTAGVGFFGVGPYVDNVYTQFATTDQNLVAPIYTDRDNYRTAHKTYLGALKTLAGRVLTQMINEEFPLSSPNSIPAALVRLYDEMTAASATVQASTVTAGAQTAYTGVTNVGNVTIVASVKAGTGRTLEYAIPETVSFTCTADAVSGGTTVNQERWTAQGQNAQNDLLSWDWPSGGGTSTMLTGPFGSGGSASLTVVDATANNSGGNVLQNSDFETFTNTNVADNWTTLVGTAGTDFQKGTTAYTGSSSLQFIGGTGVNTSIAQKFNTTPATGIGLGGTAYKIGAQPDVPFAVNFFIKADVVPAAGVITVDLVDGSNNPINDDQSVANSLAITLSGITTSFVAKNAVFRLPANPPTTVKLRIRASTAISAGTNIFIDHLAMNLMVQLNANYGPFFSIFSGSTAPVKGDAYTIAITQVQGRFQQLFQRLLNIHTLTLNGQPLILPSSGSPSIADTLIA